MSPKTYISRLFLFSFIAVLLVVGLNYAVDPYAITGVKRIPAFNQYKVDINNHTRLSKKYQPLQRPYDALVVGNSRVEMGIDPAHYCFTASGLDVYNLGMPGAGVRQQLEYALNVIYQQPVETVLLSVDFTDFISSRPDGGGRNFGMIEQDKGVLRYLASGELNPEFLQLRLLDYYKALFSLDALISSAKTVAMQSDADTDRDEAGFNPARDFAQWVRVEGPGALFDQKLQDLERKYTRTMYLRDESGKLNQRFDDIEEFLTIALERGVEVIVFTNPFHESYWSLMERHGLMPLYEDWFESIQSVVASHQTGAVSLWDFSRDSPYIHEAVPADGVKTGPLNWFWEPAHYRKELGDLMVDAMFSGACNRETVFGAKLP